MKINIPQKFDEKLSGDYRAFIDGTISNFSSIIQDNKLEFFQEFTDHGIEHIEDVLNTACGLISDETFEHINEKDIAVLVMAVILHDVGMHISVEGFVKIFSKEYDDYRISFFDKNTWEEKWNEFLYEAKRFNDEQLLDIFGNSNVVIDQPDFDNLDDQSRKLIGEFLRRHHARLSHEIAIGGFPTSIGTSNIKTNTKIDNEIIDLCGLVARSHGMNLRNSFDYLKDKHEDTWKVPFDIKVVFLMVVLRIADYIQIHSERANPILVKTKRFSSPISKKEWKKHDSIKDISIKTADPERIFVKAKPENSLIFLELRKLFDDIQYEFDISWAILGEVYGKDEELKNLKIKFRRLTSNLDNIEKFEKTVDYIPQKIRFDADPELLKLLIGPLYGEDPKYGVRELLQNSVDAVKERAFVDSTHTEQEIIVSLEQPVKNSNEYWLTIKDNGIGMTKETIINFFFRAGASFRNSMLWKKSFIEKSEVKIEKTGRFGVGVLAAFLLGDEFELHTKHHNDKIGYHCKASLSTKQVELIKQDCEEGTFIKIKLSQKINYEFLRLIGFYKTQNDRYSFFDEKNQKLSWFNWYVMNSPKIIYRIENDELKRIFEFNRVSISSLPEEPLKGWHKLSTDEFKAIHWTIDNRDQDYYTYGGRWEEKPNNQLYCNGFKVLRGYKMPDFPWRRPLVSVFDGNAKMPLSLSRDYLLNDRLPFEDKLIEGICRKVIESLMKTEFEKVGKYWRAKDNILKFVNNEINLSDYVVVSGDKFVLMTPFIFNSLQVEMFYQLWLKEGEKNNFLFSNKKVFYQVNIMKNDPNYFYKNLLELPYGVKGMRDWFGLGETKNRNDMAYNDYVLNDKLAYMSEKNRLSKSFREGHKSQLFNDRWAIIKNDRRKDEYIEKDYTDKKVKIKKKKITLNETQIDKALLTNDYYYFIKEYYINVNSQSSFKKFKELWEENFGINDYLIPIKKEYRKEFKTTS
ncbi:ATP-binding protein [Algibacter sp. L1A34]|uniref:HD domain-containing protein n=1 Tax=Algibacter sp. L1A34 TaxID=2686365 RepID=UPI00131C2B8E|nr:ATP-binding protein [Algibacter sp. L1A34]